MELNIVTEVAALERLSVGQLRQRFAELFGEATLAGNRTWLIKRIAWRMQALAEGDLSERARRRAAELARDADLRLNPPRSASIPPPPQPVCTPAPVDHRLPPPGTVLTRPYKGQLVQVQVLTDGFAYAGRVYASLSAVAKALTGSHCNGFHFFRNALTPDLFHVQRELSKATSLSLHRQVETAQQEVARAQTHTHVQRQRQQDYQCGPRPPGRPPDFASDIRLAEGVERQATADLAQRQQRQQQARQAVRDVAEDYHPFDAQNGQPVSATTVGQRLEQRMQAVEQIIDAAQLGESSRQALARARRWLVPLVASLS